MSSTATGGFRKAPAPARGRRRLALPAEILWLGASSPVWGAAAGPAPAANPLPDPTFTVVRMFGAFIFVIALFLCGVWVWRNWQRVLVKSGRAPKLRVLEARSLGARHTLYVVSYEQERWMLAASPSGISLVAPLPPETAPGPPPSPAETEAAAAGAASFAERLHKLLRGQ